MKYNVYIQDNFYKIVEAEDVKSAIFLVGQDIANNLVTIDTSKDQNIKLEPINE